MVDTLSLLTETEIKLRLPPAEAERVMTHPVVSERRCGEWVRSELLNQYYDTPDLALDRIDLALRLRRDGDQVIQTLKGRGRSLAGLSVRNEWDWYLQHEQLDRERLRQPELPTALNGVELDRLRPLFRTDFTRRRTSLRWRHAGDKVEVELALDRGDVVAGDRREPLCELELELRGGPADALLDLAVELAATLPLLPWDSAKAERGFRLVDPTRRPRLPELHDWSLDQPAGGVLLAVAHTLLSRAVCWCERLFLGDDAAPRGMIDTLAQLGALATVQGAPGFVSPALRQSLDALTRQLTALDTDRADTIRMAITDSPEWGHTLLQLSRGLQRAQVEPQGVDFAHWKRTLGELTQPQAELIHSIEEGAIG